MAHENVRDRHMRLFSIMSHYTTKIRQRNQAETVLAFHVIRRVQVREQSLRESSSGTRTSYRHGAQAYLHMFRTVVLRMKIQS